jgi:hypothetical protein
VSQDSASTPGGRPGTPRLAPFAVVVVALLGLGLVGQLALNTALQHGSFNLHTLSLSANALDERRQALEQEVARQEEPGNLAELARDLGMVASENPVFLRLSDGGVAGTPVAATAPPPPPTTAPPTTAPPATAPATTAPVVPPTGAPPTTSTTP